MNQRIKELAEQSGAVQYGVDYRRDTYPVNLEELKKFAELIVRECADLVQKHMTRWPEDCELTKQIKEHFGVER